MNGPDSAFQPQRGVPVRVPCHLDAQVPTRGAGPPVDERLKDIVSEVIRAQDAWLQAMEAMPDHVHLLVRVDSSLALHRLVKAPKDVPHAFFVRRSRICATAPYAMEQHFVATTDGTPMAAINPYVENQKYV